MTSSAELGRSGSRAAAPYSERQRARRLLDRIRRGILVGSSHTVGRCPGCGLAVLDGEAGVIAEEAILHVDCEIERTRHQQRAAVS
jgi:hypothetical protein